MHASEVLERGELEVLGRLVQASNATLRCRASLDGDVVECVYKPVRGEKPLWDFAEGTLGRREVATYAVSQVVCDRDIVPMTVWREQGPYGPGMCQMWIEEIEQPAVDLVAPDSVPAGWFRIVDGEDYEGSPVTLVHADRADLRELAILDAVVNNTDRKGGHVLVDATGQVRGIDHGVTFHTDDKLRTVLWGWALTPLTDPECERLVDSRDAVLGGMLDEWLATREVAATVQRIERLLDANCLPAPDGSWPPIPWPAF